MSSHLSPLLYEARRALDTTQEGLGNLIGASRRTAQRWASGHSTPTSRQVNLIAGLVHPHNRDLAERLAAAGGTTLIALGLEKPPAPPAPPHAALKPRHLADSMVCVAAEALGMPPSALRPALRAAFERARELGLSLAEAEAALREPTLQKA